MARPISDEELQLKKRARRRLVGAVILVTAAAVLLPMVLDSEPKPLSQNIDIQIPSPDSGEFKPKSAASSSQEQPKPAARYGGASPQPAAAVAGSTDPSPAVSGDKGPSAASSSEKTSAPVSSKEKTATATTSGDKPATSAKSAEKAAVADPPRTPVSETAAAGSYAVQVAALADARKVKELEKQMSGAGLKTYTEVVNTQAGEVTRVRAGPYASREAAEKARAQLKKAGLDGKIVQK
jgi:DedD protein